MSTIKALVDWVSGKNSLWFTDGTSLLHPHREKTVNKLPPTSFIQALISLMRVLPSLPSRLPGAPSLNTFTVGIRFQCINIGRNAVVQTILYIYIKNTCYILYITYIIHTHIYVFTVIWHISYVLQRRSAIRNQNCQWKYNTFDLK